MEIIYLESNHSRFLYTRLDISIILDCRGNIGGKPHVSIHHMRSDINGIFMDKASLSM